MVSSDDPCPCHSGKSYGTCCRDFHTESTLPPTALHLMRSRYAAFSLHLNDYIIATTYPSNRCFQLPIDEWKANIAHFCSESTFPGLDILEAVEEGSRATVTFRAHLIQNQRPTSFCEKSSFLKVNGKWYYVDGEMQ